MTRAPDVKSNSAEKGPAFEGGSYKGRDTERRPEGLRFLGLLTVLECVGSGERLDFGAFPGVSSRSPHG